MRKSSSTPTGPKILCRTFLSNRLKAAATLLNRFHASAQLKRNRIIRDCRYSRVKSTLGIPVMLLSIVLLWKTPDCRAPISTTLCLLFEYLYIVLSYFVKFFFCLVLFCLILSCLALPCLCLVLPCLLAFPCLVLSCLVCLVLSCRALSLSGLVFAVEYTLSNTFIYFTERLYG